MKFLEFMDMKLESKKHHRNDVDIYWDTFTGAVTAAREYAEDLGYEIDQHDWDVYITFGPGRPKDGKTTRALIRLWKDGKSKRALNLSVYNMGTKYNTYELVFYIA